MASKLNFIKNITNADAVTTYQLILNSLFGDNIPKEYDPTKTYSKGDPIISLMPNGNYVLKIATGNDITGIYNDNDWHTIYFTNLFGEGSSLDVDFSKAIQIAVEQPQDKDNRMWFQPVVIKSGDGGSIDLGGLTSGVNINVYENEHFAAQDDEPSEPKVRLWFDYEE